MSAIRFRSARALGRLGIIGAIMLVVAFCWPGAAGATIQPSTHTCAPFLGDSTYQGGQCYDLDIFTNSAGALALRTRGQSFCQYRAAPQALLRCAGISQTVTIRDNDTGVTMTQTFNCGRYDANSTQCPVERFQNFSPGLLCVPGHAYILNVSTTVVLPVYATVAHSGSLQTLVANWC